MRTIRVTAHRGGKVLHYTRHITPKQIAAAKRNVKVARKAWVSESHLARQKAMPAYKFRGMTEAQIKAEMVKEHKRFVPIGGFAWIDVGRPKHHYVLAKKTKFGWEKEKFTTKEHVGEEGRHKWLKMSHAARARAMPERKGKAGYTKKLVTKTSVLGHRYKAPVWVRK
jgi:hypothetical protein